MIIAFLFDVVAALAVTVLLAEGYGLVRRKLTGSLFAPYVLGMVFGLIALVQMHNPIEPVEGLILDLRNIPIALAGAFLGWRGLLPCLAIAMLTRISFGGVGMESGLWAMVIAGVAGVLWARKAARYDARSLGGFVLLGLAMSSHLFAALILPQDIAVWFLTTAALPMLALNMISIPIVAAMLERENHRITRDNRLVASATHDPASGLLLAPAFLREMTNAYTARAFGTYVGFLIITPERGIWRTAAGLFGDPDPVVLDRQALSVHLEHAALGGLCADGRVMVPLSGSEVHHISRVKATLNLALRDVASVSGGGVVSVALYEVRDPAEFLRMTETAVKSNTVDRKADAKAKRLLYSQNGNAGPSRRGTIFDREEHDLLFAKADFLIRRRQQSVP